MITRHYICNHCGTQFTHFESIYDTPQQQCPQCMNLGLFQDLTGQIHIISKEPTTLGQQAERNAKSLGKYGLEKTRKRDKQAYNERKLQYLKSIKKLPEDATEIPELPKPWYNPEGANIQKELGNMTKKDAQKYILEGK